MCVTLVLVFYVRSAWTNSKDLDPAPDRTDFQNLQADAVLAGQMHLTVPVPAGLRSLPDPYDPNANLEYRTSGLHDLSYYKGRLYAYFGIAPALLLYIPYRLLGVGDLSPALACLIFCSGGFLASVAAMRLLSERFLGSVPVIAEGIAILALGIGAPVGWLISIGRGYEVAIACGYFLVTTGLYFLCRGLFRSRRLRPVSLGLGSLALAGAVAARPNLLWAMAFVVYGLVYLYWTGSADPARRRATVALVVPASLVAAAIAWFNWSRFGSVTEFGTSYMLLGENVRLARANEVEFLWRGLYDYLLAPARWSAAFPWLRLREASIPQPTELNYLEEPVAGLVPNLPVAVAGIVAFMTLPFQRIARLQWFSILIAIMVAVPFLTLATISFAMHGATMRYQVDWAPLLVMASVLGFLAFLREKSGRQRGIWIGVAAALLAWSALFSVGITLYPCAGTGSC